MNNSDRDFWKLIRQALLMVVDAIETHKLELSVKTSDIRKMYKNGSNMKKTKKASIFRTLEYFYHDNKTDKDFVPLASEMSRLLAKEMCGVNIDTVYTSAYSYGWAKRDEKGIVTVITYSSEPIKIPASILCASCSEVNNRKNASDESIMAQRFSDMMIDQRDKLRKIIKTW